MAGGKALIKFGTLGWLVSQNLASGLLYMHMISIKFIGHILRKQVHIYMCTDYTAVTVGQTNVKYKVFMLLHVPNGLKMKMSLVMVLSTSHVACLTF